jgi:thymidylate synthase (FAD)
MKVRPVSITQPLPGAVPDGPTDLHFGPEALIVYCARVSSPQNQPKHQTGPRLLRYCIEHGHWSPFELVDLTVEIETSRAIAAQILRHRSFSFQEFSQRYSAVDRLGEEMYERPEMRAKHVKGNRQGSDEVNPLQHPNAISALVTNHLAGAEDLYRRLLEENVAPECARMVLPLCTRTRLYMKGSVRSWIHYLQVRCDGHAQKEHRQVAEAVKGHFVTLFPVISEALDWVPSS